MDKSEAAEIARAVRQALKDHPTLDVLMDECGSVFVIPPGAELIGRYDAEASARMIASDVLHVGKNR